jgi:hypothetical protein
MITLVNGYPLPIFRKLQVGLRDIQILYEDHYGNRPSPNQSQLW